MFYFHFITHLNFLVTTFVTEIHGFKGQEYASL